MKRLLIFSDLDGTLLDHHTYSFQPALRSMQALKTLAIPCILNTSKTFAELKTLREELDHKDPFIVENGAAVYIPKSLPITTDEPLEDVGEYWLKAFGPKRSTLIQLTDEKKQSFSFERFSDMNWKEVVSHTGLSESKAMLAMEREFTEPMIWTDSQKALETFSKALKPFGIQVQRGGRFTHLMGEHCDKAKAMLWLSKLYERHYGAPVTTMALGDGENDVGMLSQADIPVVVRSPVHVPPEVPNRRDVWLTDAYGPTGWAQAIDLALQEQGII